MTVAMLNGVYGILLFIAEQLAKFSFEVKTDISLGVVTLYCVEIYLHAVSIDGPDLELKLS